MSTYVPEEGSTAAAALTFIFKYRTARSSTLSCAVGKSIADIHAALEPAVEAGLVVACDVTTPAGAMKDYRPAGEAKLPAFSIIAKVEANESKPAPTQAAAMMQELAQTVAAAASAAPAVAAVCESVQVATPADVIAPTPATPPRTSRQIRADDLAKELQVSRAIPARGDGIARIVAFLRTRGTSAMIGEVHAELGGTYHAVYMTLRRAEKAGVVESVLVGKKQKAYLLPGGEGAETPAGAAAAPPPPKRSGSRNKSHQEATNRRSEAPAAVIQPAPVPTLRMPSVSADQFRFGLLSDGALRIEGAAPPVMGAVVLDPAQTNDLVAYLRKLDMLGGAAA